MGWTSAGFTATVLLVRSKKNLERAAAGSLQVGDAQCDGLEPIDVLTPGRQQSILGFEDRQEPGLPGRERLPCEVEARLSKWKQLGPVQTSRVLRHGVALVGAADLLTNVCGHPFKAAQGLGVAILGLGDLCLVLVEDRKLELDRRTKSQVAALGLEGQPAAHIAPLALTLKRNDAPGRFDVLRGGDRADARARR